MNRYEVRECESSGSHFVYDGATGRNASTFMSQDSAYETAQRLENEYIAAKETVSLLFRFLNRGGSPQDFALAASCEHRTLQQEFTKVVVAWIERLAGLPDTHYDLRNEDSVKLAKMLVCAEGWERFKHLRFI